MKKVVTLLAALLLISTSVYAAEIPKVGVIDLPQIMQTSPQVAAINKKLQSQFEPEQQKIMQAQTALRAQADKLAPGNKLADADRKALEKKIADDQKNLQAMVVKFQETVAQAQTQAMKQFMDQINGIVKNIAQKQSLTMVLLKPAVVYANETVDITGQVLSELPKK